MEQQEASRRSIDRGSVPGWRAVSVEARLAARLLWRRPRTALAIVALAALGLGAFTAVWGALDAVLLRPLPYPHGERLVMVWNELRASGLARLPLSLAQVEALEATASLERVGGVWAGSAVLALGERPRDVTAGYVTPELLPLLGVRPALGRLPAADEQGRGTVSALLLSDALWRQELGGDRSVLGRTVRFAGAPATVIGVLPPDFALLLPADSSVPPRLDVVAPLPWPASQLPPDQFFLRVVARLEQSATLPAARGEAAALSSRLRADLGSFAELDVETGIEPLRGDAGRRLRPTLLALAGGAVLFLLVGASNVASLLLVYLERRRGELRICAALGAAPHRLALRLAAEIFALLGAGATLGVVGGLSAARRLWSLRPAGLSAIEQIAPGPSLVAALAAALLPLGGATAVMVWRAVRASATPRPPRRTPGGRPSLRASLAALQLAVGVVLVSGALLLLRSLAAQRQQPLGFDPVGRIGFRVALAEKIFRSGGERVRVVAEIERRLGALAGVRAIGGVSHLPLGEWANWSENVAREGMSRAEEAHVDHRAVTPGYFDAIGARLSAGRPFRDSDDAEAPPVVILDQPLAERLFGSLDPLGRSVRVTRYHDGTFVPTWARVVGVVQEIRDRGPATPSSGQVYLPFAQSARWEISFVARADNPQSALADPLAATLARVGELAPARLETLEAARGRALAPGRFTSLLAAAFALLSLALTAFGLYGLVAAAAAERRLELSLRLALGAGASGLLASGLAPALRLLAVGLAVGLAAALAAAGQLRALLYQVAPRDPWVHLAAAALLGAVTLAAAARPAWRASRSDPAAVLRRDRLG